MQKDFNGWTIKKRVLDAETRIPFINERDVFWCSIGINVGDEENGKSDTFSRPVLIFKKFNAKLFWGIPLSSKIKNNNYYVSIDFKSRQSSVMVSHLRLYDVRRLGLKMGRMEKGEYNKIIKIISNLIPKPLGETWGRD